MKPIIKKILIGAGILGVGYYLYNKMGSGSAGSGSAAQMLDPWAKMALDVQTPGTEAYSSQASYLQSVGAAVNSANLLSFVDYRKANPSDPAAVAYLAKPSWNSTDVVTW